MTDIAASHKAIKALIIWVLALLALLPWIIVQAQAMLVGNVTWLLMAAERLLHGMSLFEGAYETNPPLSIMIYIPHVLLARLADFSVPIGATAFTFFAIVVSTFVVHKLTALLTTLSCNEKNALVFGYLAGATCVSTIAAFADREHLMILALFPFILCQYLMGEKVVINKALLFSVLFFGTLAVLVKPHYGLLPSVFLLHRMLKQRRLNIFSDPDFVFLAIGTLAYIAIVLVCFPGYVQAILPDALDLYLVHKDFPLTMHFLQPHLVAYVALFMVELLMGDLDKRKKRLVLFFYICALLSLVPMLVQMKGFYNHLVPAFSFFIVALSLSVFLRAEKYLGKYKVYAFFIPVLILGTAQITIPVGRNFPSHADIKHMPAARFLEKECTKPCTFFAFHQSIEIMNSTAVYMDYIHASRFPTYWFVPEIGRQLEALAEGKNTHHPAEKLLSMRKKYAVLAAQDLERFKPSVLMISTNVRAYNNKNFDFVGFFTENETYRQTFTENYVKSGTFNFDRGVYFRGTSLQKEFILKYDIYKRKQGPWVTASFSEDKNP